MQQRIIVSRERERGGGEEGEETTNKQRQEGEKKWKEANLEEAEEASSDLLPCLLVVRQGGPSCMRKLIVIGSSRTRMKNMAR